MSPAEKNYNRTEIVTGVLVLIGIIYLIYIAIGLGRTVLGTNGYVIYADFVSVSGLNVGDPVKIAGVQIGSVESIRLADYRACGIENQRCSHDPKGRDSIDKYERCCRR